MIGEEHQSVDCLGAALDVERENLMVVVFWCPIRQEKCVLPKFVSVLQPSVKAMIASTLAVMLETVKNVASMEIVNPVQIRLFSVIP